MLLHCDFDLELFAGVIVVESELGLTLGSEF